MKRLNGRARTLLGFSLALAFLLAVTVSGALLSGQALETDFSRKDLAPCVSYLFGTDWMGRDMFVRTLAGLSMSVRIGLLTASVSALIALALGCAAAMLGPKVDSVVSWLIDLMMGIPHMLLLILISFACGKGFFGVVVGVTATHWMSLARVLRGEVLSLRSSGYIQMAAKLGKTPWEIARTHMLPHLLPQFLIGLVLLFPHAILHEASITFLGFGLSPEQPAIGIILSESMRYLSMGKWWLALFPGVLLAVTVALFDYMGRCLRRLSDVHSLHA